MHERTRHIVLASIATMIGGALFVFLVWQVGVGAIVKNLGLFGAIPFALFVVISLINFGLYSLRWQIILRVIEPGIPLRYSRLFLHRMSGFAAGYLTPAAQIAGEPVRVALLAKEGISFQAGTSSVVLDLAFEIAAFIVYVSLGIIFAILTGVGTGGLGVAAYGMFAVFICVVGGFFLSVTQGWNVGSRLFSRPFFAQSRRMRGFVMWLRDVEHIMTEFFKGRPQVLLGIILLSLVMTGFRAGEIWFIGYFFGETITFSGAILLSTIPGLVLLAPIPGGLGVFEASMTTMLATLHVGIPALALTMIIRLRDLVFMSIGFVHGLREGVGWVSRRKG